MKGLSGCHFLPHHGVIHEDKETTKLRVGFDGSAKIGVKYSICHLIIV